MTDWKGWSTTYIVPDLTLKNRQKKIDEQDKTLEFKVYEQKILTKIDILNTLSEVDLDKHNIIINRIRDLQGQLLERYNAEVKKQ